ncbi:MAG TPA: glycoside hydrolase family 28 protein [Opitutaceae bacterium]|nr:glycoside hydrolase family 28 protein [Opitutaceae bacterium]
MSPRLLPALLSFALLAAVTRGATPAVFNVLDYGAVPDGRTKNTTAFARAVAACAAAGGGTLVVPAGRYLTGSIQLESNLTLQLEAGAELLYSGDPADSPLVPARYECTNAFTHAPLLYANGKQNIAITGRGTVNGQGWNWWWRSGRGTPPAGVNPALARDEWRRLYTRIEAGEKLSADDFKLAAEFLRPSLIGIYNSRNVLVEGVTLFKSPMWMLHPTYCDDVVIRGVRFISADPDGQPSAEGVGPNGDGIDVDSCRNVRISDCFFNTSDDCIVIKSGRDQDGLRTARPTEYVTVTNCVMYKGHGAVVVGSETSGGVRNVTASNIVSKGTDCGVRIKSMRGRGGVLENFRFDNWVIEDAQKQAFEITMEYAPTQPEPVSVRTPAFHDFAFSNITVINAHQVASIVGLDERSVDRLRFSDITATGGIGFLCSRARDVELHEVRVDAGPKGAFVFDRTHDLVLDDVTSRAPSKDAPVILFKDSDDLLVRSSRAAAGTGTFLKLDGAAPSHLKLTENDFSAAAIPTVPAGL